LPLPKPPDTLHISASIRDGNRFEVRASCLPSDGLSDIDPDDADAAAAHVCKCAFDGLLVCGGRPRELHMHPLFIDPHMGIVRNPQVMCGSWRQGTDDRETVGIHLHAILLAPVMEIVEAGDPRVNVEPDQLPEAGVGDAAWLYAGRTGIRVMPREDWRCLTEAAATTSAAQRQREQGLHREVRCSDVSARLADGRGLGCDGKRHLRPLAGVAGSGAIHGEAGQCRAVR